MNEAMSTPTEETIAFTNMLCDGIEERVLTDSFAAAWAWAAQQIDAYTEQRVAEALTAHGAGP